MALTETRPEADRAAGDLAGGSQPPTAIERLIGSGDHLTVGRLYIGFGLFFTALAALGLALSGVDGLSDDGLLGLTPALASSSLVALVLMGVLPTLIGLGIYLVPRQVASPAIAFPRAAALSLWSWLIAGAIFLTGVALDGGIGGPDLEGARLSSLSMGAMMISLSLGSVCVATTVLSHRPLGMGLAKVPFFSWSMLVAAPVWILTFGSTVAHVSLAQIAQFDAEGIAVGFDTGIAWFLRVPSIYMIAVPVLGIAADVVAASSRRRIRAYGPVQGLIAAYAIASFGAWTQTSRALQTVVFALAAVLAAVPMLALLGALGDTLRRGRVALSTALLGSLLAPLLILGAALAGALQAIDYAGSGTIWDLQPAMITGSQTVFLVGAAACGAIAGLAHWSRRLWSAPAPEGPGRGGVAAVFLGAGLVATIHLLQAFLARGGESGLDPAAFNAIVAVGALVLAVGVLSGLAMTVGAARIGSEHPDPDDDEAMTLEWYPPGPVVAGAEFVDLEVVRSPYPLADLRGDTDEEDAR